MLKNPSSLCFLLFVSLLNGISNFSVHGDVPGNYSCDFIFNRKLGYFSFLLNFNLNTVEYYFWKSSFQCDTGNILRRDGPVLMSVLLYPVSDNYTDCDNWQEIK